MLAFSISVEANYILPLNFHANYLFKKFIKRWRNPQQILNPDRISGIGENFYANFAENRSQLIKE